MVQGVTIVFLSLFACFRDAKIVKKVAKPNEDYCLSNSEYSYVILLCFLEQVGSPFTNKKKLHLRIKKHF